ncbi:carbohydrate kinase family protein [Halanaerobium congolense]|jgi:sugar/nucleoside kinase (ribokinase family)|uniref:carbohydrate kinase family protein n=1 Tax=Halanaerobium congolense TaxID=54121 RepID=UPI00105B247D|nr:carbohydrate kinase family protein [Halanaerobium congolense]TDP25588.1 ribokinase [Halanaerobium congolense]
MNKKILVYGPVFADLIYSKLDGKPKVGKEVFAKNFLVTSGGLSITAVGLARLGFPTKLIAEVGNDHFGKHILKKLHSEKIDVSDIEILENAQTNISTAFVYNNDRGFITRMGSRTDLEKLHIKIISKFKKGDVSHFHTLLDFDKNIYNLLQEAKKYKIRTSLVTGWDGAKKYTENRENLVNIFKYTDYFFCNLLEAKILTALDSNKDILYKFRDWGVRPVITLGAEGAVTISDNKIIYSAVPPDVDFVDPTGAGDSFAAAFIAGLEKNYKFEKCLKIGVFCGSKSTEKIGGSTAFPKWEEIEEL